MVNGTLMVRKGGVINANRTFKSTPDYTIPNKFRVSINTPDATWTDTSLTTTIPISGTELVDDCSATTGWTASGTNSLSVNSTTYKPDTGTDGALNLIKTDTSSATIYASKTTTSLNGTSKDFLIWIYIKDATALAKLKTSGTAFEIRYGSDNSNYYYYTAAYSIFSTGWNFIKLTITSGFTGTTGTPTITALDYTYISFITNNASDTFAAGDIIYDAIRLASSDDYLKTIDSTTFDETDASVTTTSKLSITEANGFLINGHSLNNTDTAELMATKSKFPNNSKDTTDLFKITTKLKYRNISQI